MAPPQTCQHEDGPILAPDAVAGGASPPPAAPPASPAQAAGFLKRHKEPSA